MAFYVAAWLLAAAGWGESVLYFWDAMSWAKGDVVHGIGIFLGYFSNWTMLLTGLVCTLIALRRTDERVPWLATLALVANITMTLGYWSAVSWDYYRSNPLLHQAAHGPVPLAMALFWLACVRHGTLRYRDALTWTVVPLAYMVWMLGYGYLTGYFPYWELNPDRVGYRAIAAKIAMIGAATLAGGLGLVFLDRLLVPPAMRGALARLHYRARWRRGTGPVAGPSIWRQAPDGEPL